MRTEYWMKTKDLSNLDSEQLQNRFKILDLLHKYWKNETFPINTTHKQKISQIRDNKGTMCAVAYVMHHSGQQNLVSHLAQNNNYVLVDDVPDNHDLIDSLKHNGISKKEAARIQPSYSCHATIGPIHAGEPIVEFLGIILSIVGLATALSFYWGLNHVLYNIDKKTITIVMILGIVVSGGGFGMIYQNSVAEPFDDFDFSGTHGSISVVDDILTHYWIDGATIEVKSDARWFKITPDRNGQITIAYPPIQTVGYGKSYNQQNYGNDYHNYFVEDIFVLVSGKEINPPPHYNLNGYAILTIPFSEDDSSIEIIGAGLCGEFIFD